MWSAWQYVTADKYLETDLPEYVGDMSRAVYRREE